MINKILWSPVTRLIHWMIALPTLINFFSEGGERPHEVLGYLALGGVIARIGWGFLSYDKANFRYFPIGSQELKLHVQSILKAEAKDYPGHNPLASITYVLIWICIIALGISGFMMNLDAFWGEDWLEETHESISNGLMMLVIFHIFGLLIDGIRHKRKTWLGMITGRR